MYGWSDDDACHRVLGILAFGVASSERVWCVFCGLVSSARRASVGRLRRKGRRGEEREKSGGFVERERLRAT